MKKQLLCVIFPFVISGCSGVLDKQLPVCDAVANIGGQQSTVQIGNDSNLLIVFYVQIMPDDFVMQLHRF